MRLINSSFGILLDIFLKNLGNAFKIGVGYEPNNREKMLFTVYRGKLSEYNLPVLASYIVGVKFSIYFVSSLSNSKDFETAHDRHKSNKKQSEKSRKVDEL